ncbi:MAG: hypothetical protein ACFFBC_03010 [Promethearchaeota archaeon]
MKINNSNGRYSNYIAGILVFVLLFIFMGFLIGCWGCSSYEKVGAPLVFPLDSSYNVGNIKDEPAAQSRSWSPFDTVAGTLTVTEAGFYDINNVLIVNMTEGTGQFPLCISKLDGYYFKFKVETCGGYSPADYCNYIELSQFKWPDVWNLYRLHFTSVDWSPGFDAGCCDIYELEVHIDTNHYLEEKLGWCNWQSTDSICFESNHDPEDQLPDLGKEVDVKLKMGWQGCYLQSQTFCCDETWCDLDTEKGSMTYIDNYGIFADDFAFELCYHDGDILGDIYIHSVGGYTPSDDDLIKISQYKDGDGLYQGIYELTNVTWSRWVGTFDDDPMLFALSDGCCEEVFIGEIAFVYGQVILGTDLMDEIELDSNYPPDGCCPGWDLDKPVTVEIVSKWQGCGQQLQEFTYMLVHKNNISGVPNSRYFIAG